MEYNDFCASYWKYYMALESDFLKSERYLSFDLGDNYLYNGITPLHQANSLAFSIDFVKQYQAICSEVEVVLKKFCAELGNSSPGNMKSVYTPTILGNEKWNS